MILPSQTRIVTVVAHDAGGAEVVSAWVKANPWYEYQYVLNGPAVKIFCNKIEGSRNLHQEKLLKSIKESDWVLTSTSWASDLERVAIAHAKKHRIKCVSFLDHWCNYRPRFQHRGKQVLPDEIWVGDEYAFALASKTFPGTPLSLVPNPYFKELKRRISHFKQKKETDGGIKILYICEPIGDRPPNRFDGPKDWGYNEFDALRLFINKLESISSGKKVKIVRLRPHPFEPPTKYNEFILQYQDIPWQVSSSRELIEDCTWADIIVGCESMALIVGLLAKKQVYSVIPQGGKPCSLPFEEIIHLN